MQKEPKKNKTQLLLPAAQVELDQKLQICSRAAIHAEAYNLAELMLRGMKMQAIRAVAENSEVLEKAGYKRLEDFFEKLGIKHRTGFNLKRIAEAFSDEELQFLQSAGVSKGGVLRLASLPPGQLSQIKETDDPEELKSQIEDLLTDIEKQKKAHSKDVKDLYKQIDTASRDTAVMKDRLDKFDRLYPEDDKHWVKSNRKIHAEKWEACLEEFRTFVMNDRAALNDEAQEYMREFYDRIVGNLGDLNESYKQRTGGRSFMRAK